MSALATVQYGKHTVELLGARRKVRFLDAEVQIGAARGRCRVRDDIFQYRVKFDGMEMGFNGELAMWDLGFTSDQLHDATKVTA